MKRTRRISDAMKTLLKTVDRQLTACYGVPACPLVHSDPYQLLVAVILSAQCTDKRVNALTPALFRRYPNLLSMAEAEPEQVMALIKSAGCFRVKARHIIGSCRKILTAFQGKIPDSMAELTTLPGVGRKSANVLLGNAFGKPGFPVDTHVIRVLNRLGAVDSRNPVQIEMVVNRALAPARWTEFSHLLINHGRRRCSARRPDCGHCELRNYCHFFKTQS